MFPEELRFYFLNLQSSVLAQRITTVRCEYLGSICFLRIKNNKIEKQIVHFEILGLSSTLIGSAKLCIFCKRELSFLGTFKMVSKLSFVRNNLSIISISTMKLRNESEMKKTQINQAFNEKTKLWNF